jgi:plasmid stability protein
MAQLTAQGLSMGDWGWTGQHCYRDSNVRGLAGMAQLLVRNLEASVKEALRRKAQRHGRSMEEEVRLILRQAAALEQDQPHEAIGLGSQMAALFADSGPGVPMPEWQGYGATPAAFDP